MAFLLGEIVANVRADSGQFRSEIRNVERQGARSSQNVQRSFDGIGRKLATVTFLAKALFTSAIVMGARQAVREFAYLEGALAKFDVVFAEQSEEMRAWVDQFREGVPLARREIVAASAALQDLLIPMGVARRDATEMTKEWMELAGALAAFNDTNVTEVLDAMQSAIAGQSRPLRRFGIDVRETALQQTALENGLIKSGEAMNNTARQQALLIQAYAQSKDAIDGYSDQLGTTLMMEQELGATYKDTLAILGEGLQPAYNSLLKTLVQVLNITKNLSGESAGLASIINLQARAIGINLTSIKNGIGGLIDFAEATTGARKASRDFYQELERGLTGDLNSDELSRLASNLSTELEKISSLAISMGIDPEDFMPFQELMGNAHALGAILEQSLKKGEEGFDETSEAVQKTLKTVGDLKQEILDLEKSIDGSFDSDQIALFKHQIDEIDIQISKLMGTFESLKPKVENVPPLYDQIFPDDLPIEKLLTDLEHTEKALEDLLSSTEDFTIEPITEELQESTGAARFFSQTLADGLEQVLFNARSVEDALKGIARQLASRALTTLLFGAFTGGFGAGGFFGAMFGGFRANGGNVQAGKGYMVGERGPELFLPSQGGNIVANQSMGGGSITPSQMERAFLSAMDKKLSKLGPEEVFAMGQKGRLSY